ncbi:hypothetical protein JCM10207_006361 [Rhodosporidiobolus poonsookiae]
MLGRSLLAPLLLVASAALRASAYQVLVDSSDEVRQVCSGMYGKGVQDPFIEVIFSPSSRGQLALVVFEWEDAKYLGVGADGKDSENDWSADRTYICTLAAQEAGLCKADDLGRFLTTSSNPSNSSIFTTSVRFDAVASAPKSGNNALGTGPYRYEVGRTGYYCVGAVPVTLEGARINTTYTGVVDFENAFVGHLPSAEYPKVAFYRILFLVYLVFAAAWCALCWTYRRDLLPLQRYITAAVAFLVVEQLMTWRYWNALNEGIHEGVAGFYLIIVSALNAARNSVSLYLLCLAAMGLSVVRPNLGGVLPKVRLLGMCHFVFGLLYSLGTVTIPLEAAGLFVFFFVLPLAFSLTAFLCWIMYSLNSTISELSARRQVYKKTMFTRLYYILLAASSLILLFFLASSLLFTSRTSPSFPAQTWQTRWLLLDGWLSILFAAVFFAVAFLWRPAGSNRRLALSDEVPLSEGDADLYDVDAMLDEEERDRYADEGDRDASELKETYPLRRISEQRGGGREGTPFEVGSSDEDEEEDEARARGRAEKEGGKAEETAGLMGDDEFDITKQHSAGLDAPPSYRSHKND